jgi:uncharacterized membrane protein YhaH (DUF805 family)
LVEGDQLQGRVGRGAAWGSSFLVYSPLVFGVVSTSDTAVAIIWIAIALLGFLSLSFQVRRCHDRGKSGFWLLLGVIPILGGLWALIELGCLPGDPGDNAHGPPGGGSPFSR